MSTTWMERNQVHFGRITKLYYNNHSPEKHPEIHDFIYVVVSTHLKHMIVKLEIFPK